LDWWRLSPRNELIAADVPQSEERRLYGQPATPARAYWCLAEPGAQYVLYLRGMTGAVTLNLDAPAGTYAVRQYDPRTGAYQALGSAEAIVSFAYRPPDARDWVVTLRAG
jgi:hypothetical protein